MRWLLVSRQHQPSHGGIGTYVQRFCRAAKAGGWDVEVLTQPGDQWPLCSRVHELTTPDMRDGFDARLPELRRRHVVRPYRYALWAKAVAERLLTMRGGFDAIEFVDSQAEGFAAIGCQAVRERHRGARFIVHAHTPMWVEERINGADAAVFGRPIYYDWERRAVRQADGVIVTANVLADAIADVASATVIPYPVDREPIQRQTGLGRQEERIVLVGTVQPRKGVDAWARSLNRVLRARPRATAMLIGPDTPTAPDGLSMAAHVQRLIDHRMLDRFRWVGSMEHDRVREIIATSALVVVPSRLESFSFVAAEALLAGTPVIVSDQTGIAEHVPSVPTVPCADLETWAETQIAALNNAEHWKRNAITCRDEMLESCRPARVLQLRERFVQRCASRPYDAGAEETADALSELSSFVAAVDEPAAASSDVS